MVFRLQMPTPHKGFGRAIRASAWGQVITFTRYKAVRHHKLVITVLPQHSSQECTLCTFTSPDNRLSQAVFVCQRCGTPTSTR